jgi:hypothetical protein
MLRSAAAGRNTTVCESRAINANCSRWSYGAEGVSRATDTSCQPGAPAQVGRRQPCKAKASRGWSGHRDCPARGQRRLRRGDLSAGVGGMHATLACTKHAPVLCAVQCCCATGIDWCSVLCVAWVHCWVARAAVGKGLGGGSSCSSTTPPTGALLSSPGDSGWLP